MLFLSYIKQLKLQLDGKTLDDIKGTRDQSNFCLKWSFFTIKKNNINQKFRKFAHKP